MKAEAHSPDVIPEQNDMVGDPVVDLAGDLAGEAIHEPLDDDVVGTVVEEDRGSLPFALIHGESLVACASWALGAAGVRALAFSTTWAEVKEIVADAQTPFVLHDALCPLVDPSTIAALVRKAAAQGVVVVGARPVSDTVKVVRAGALGETVDRDGLLVVASPIVVPAWVLADLERLPSLDFAALTTVLQARYPLEFVEVPAAGRRVSSPAEVEVLGASTRPDGSFSIFSAMPE